MAEINFNNLYNQLTPMEQDQYDGVFGSSGFKDKYAQNPDSPLVTQNSNYEKLKAVADAEAQVPETSMFGGMMDTLNPFSKLSAAEPDIYNSVPSYTPNNLPFTSMSDMYNLSQRDLVDQINMGPRSITPPMTIDQIMSGSVLPNNQFNPTNFQSIFPASGIMQQAPLDMNRFQGVSDMSIIDETTNDEQDENYINQVNKNNESGIMQLIKSLIPGSTLAKIAPQDPRATGIRNFYSPEGLTSTGSVASGIMKDYNPVSGGFLNMITGGKFGKPTQYGLSGAMQRRIENIIGRRAPQTDSSRSKISELRNLQRQEMQDRSGRGESLGSIGRSTFSGPGMAFEKQSGGSSGKKGTSSERNYGGR